jgi:hypothetical protein
MRIDGKLVIAGPVNGPARRAGSGGFSLPETPAGSTAASIAGTAGLGGIEALLVLQGEEDPARRRRRAIGRGSAMLDALDGLKASILSGRIAGADLVRIRALLAERRQATDDPSLDDVLAHIELRAEVELAKLAARQA